MCTAIIWTTKGEYAVAAFYKLPKKGENNLVVSFLYVFNMKK